MDGTMTRIGKGLFFVVALCILFAARVRAQATYTASSCQESAVQTAINNEQAHPVDGDVISIPAGSCSWSSQLTQTFNNSVTIQGAGAVSATTGGASTTGSDLTIITNTGSNDAMAITTVSGKSFRITGIAIVTSTPSNGLLDIDGTSTSVRVDHCHFRVI